MMKRLITYSCMAIFAMGSMAQNQKDEAQMNRFISGLMKKMTLEEKQVIDEFEGSAAEYEKTLAEKDYYLHGAGNLLTIA